MREYKSLVLTLFKQVFKKIKTEQLDIISGLLIGHGQYSSKINNEKWSWVGMV